MTDESVYLGRRALLRGAAGLALGAVTGLAWPARARPLSLDLETTRESVAASYNNFYEFGPDKKIQGRARNLTTDPWSVRIDGLVERPATLDVDRLTQLFPPEERIYRFRCVEAWAMVVPWTGFPLERLLAWAGPKREARYVRFTSFYRPSEAWGQLVSFWHPWPYTEGLTLAEARHELVLLATGIYGKPLPPQHGAPVRLVVPWKYGFKSLKSLVRIELVRDRPATFWNQIQPDEYDFQANVNPWVPHPRWSQSTERLLGTDIRQPTLLYNGYAEHVAGLYR